MREILVNVVAEESEGTINEQCVLCAYNFPIFVIQDSLSDKSIN